MFRYRRFGESGSPPRHLNNLGQNVADPRAHRDRVRARYPPRNPHACAFRHRAIAGPGWRRASPRSWCRAPACARAGVSGEVVTTTTASTRFSPPVSNSSGTSTTTTGAPDRFGVVEEFLTGGAEHRMHDLLELLHRGGIVHHAAPKAWRDRPCRRRWCRETPPRSPAPPRPRRSGGRPRRRRRPERRLPRTVSRWWISPSRSSRSVQGSAFGPRFGASFTHRAAARCAETQAAAAAAGRGW